MLANARGLRWKDETTKSLRVPVVCASSRPSHRPPAAVKGMAAIAGMAHVAARMVLFAAHADQKQAKIRMGITIRSSCRKPTCTQCLGEQHRRRGQEPENR